MWQKLILKSSFLILFLITPTGVGICRWELSKLTGAQIGCYSPGPFGSIGNNLLAAFCTSIYLSSDTGASWTTIAEWYGQVNEFTVIGCNIYATTDYLMNPGSVYVSTDSGSSWLDIGSDFGSDSGHLTGLVLDSENFYAVTGKGGIYLSTNNGVNWRSIVPDSPDSLNLWSVVMYGKNIVGGTLRNGAYLFTISDSSWNPINTGLGQEIGIQHIAVYDGHVFAIAFDSIGDTRVFELSNNARWNPSLLDNGSDFVGAVSLTVGDGLLLAGELGGGIVYFFNDSSGRWSPLTVGDYRVSCEYLGVVGNNIFSAGNPDQFGGVYKYSFSELSISDVRSGQLENSNGGIRVFPNPSSGGLQILGGQSGEVHLFDLMGRERMNATLIVGDSKSGNATLDISSLPPGMYFISDGHSQTKFVKE